MPDDKGISLTYQLCKSIYSVDVALFICSTSLFLTNRVVICYILVYSSCLVFQPLQI